MPGAFSFFLKRSAIRDNPGPRAVLIALERLANEYEDDCRHLTAEIALKEGQHRDYRGEDR